MNAYVEHVNIDVSNLDEAVRFLRSALPEFQIRGGGTSNGVRWLHIGDDSSYLALNEAGADQIIRDGKLNHIGFAVSDVSAIKARLLTSGYREGFVAEPHAHRKRLYFLDHDGLEWEFVEYLSDNATDRNSYAESGDVVG